MNPWTAFAIRLVVALVGGYVLVNIFFHGQGLKYVLILAAIILGAAYLSQWLRRRNL